MMITATLYPNEVNNNLHVNSYNVMVCVCVCVWFGVVWCGVVWCGVTVCIISTKKLTSCLPQQIKMCVAKFTNFS